MSGMRKLASVGKDEEWYEEISGGRRKSGVEKYRCTKKYSIYYNETITVNKLGQIVINETHYEEITILHQDHLYTLVYDALAEHNTVCHTYTSMCLCVCICNHNKG